MFDVHPRFCVRQLLLFCRFLFFVLCFFKPAQEVFLFVDLPFGLVFGRELHGVSRFGKALSVGDAGFFGRVRERGVESLVDAAWPGRDVAIAEGFFAVGTGVRFHSGILDGVDFR